MNSLLEHISLLTRILGSPVAAVTLAASVPRDDAGDFDQKALGEELKHQGFENHLQKRPLRKIPQLALPAVILLRDGEAAVLKKLAGDEAVIEFAGIGEQRLATAELEAQYLGYAWFIKPKAAKDVRSELPEYELPKGWFWRVIWRFRRYYYQVIIATFLINFLALVSSLYVMNVYDRVIPNKSMETLWVLSIGVSLAIFFEFLAKLIRGHLTDIAGKKADLIISAALFRRVMQLRMSDKPASSGSYAMSGLHDEKVDAAISKAAATQPGDERRKAIMAAEQAILATGAAIPLAHERVIQGEAAGVTGAQRDPDERALITSATTVKK